MFDAFIEFIRPIEQPLMVLGGAWVLYNRLDNRFDFRITKLEDKIEAAEHRLETKIDKAVASFKQDMVEANERWQVVDRRWERMFDRLFPIETKSTPHKKSIKRQK